MADPAGLDRLVHRVAAEVRLRRAEYYGLRGLFWGALLAALPLLAKSALVAVVALALLPAISLPIGRLPDFTATPEEEAARERADALQTADPSRDKPEAVKAEGLTERDFERPNASMIHAGDRPALFKDTALSGERPDFSAFMKKGDERLRLLEQVDSLPDLQSDFTQSQYQKLAQQSKALTAGLRPDQIPQEKLRELLEQMEQMGNKEGNGPGQAASQGLKALEEGKQDRAA